MTTYATEAELIARLSPSYSAAEIGNSAAITLVLGKASELIDDATFGRAQAAYDSEDAIVPPDPTPYRTALSKATCDQVEFWLEAGEEHDVASLAGSLIAGRVQVHPVAPVLGRRAKRTLAGVGLYWLGVGVR